ncbi:hypothetical protein [Sphingobacterium suaedae]|uniref:Uncharacterized protein n=1 Tax=Sphingobacterium suaedae TaxID=1686402 RepID=A0ABW5KME3_9SPHI
MSLQLEVLAECKGVHRRWNLMEALGKLSKLHLRPKLLDEWASPIPYGNIKVNVADPW